ncbi:alpha/beta hydrolase, partial [Streptococcus thermophilus]
MKLNKKTKLVFILVALFLIGLAVPSYSWTRKNVKEIETFYNS